MGSGHGARHGALDAESIIGGRNGGENSRGKMKALLPASTIDDSLDLRLGNIESHGKPNNGHILAEVPNFFDLFFGKFCLAVSFARLHRAVLSFIVGILFAGSPSKIFKIVVKIVTVQMSRFMALWAWTAKSFKDNLMEGFVDCSSFAIDKTGGVITKLMAVISWGNAGFPTFPKIKKAFGRSATHNDAVLANAISWEAWAMFKV